MVEQSSRAASRSRPSDSGAAVQVAGLTKRFGSLTAVDNLSFQVSPGRVTGFLGPNGSGKTTTLRILLGLARPTAGSATIDNKRYAEMTRPLRVVGAALEATSVHPGRTGLDHLRCYAPLAGASDARCRELLDLVGLGPSARRRVGAYSLGMRQRLALAQALLGDPRVLVLDEPANGLDPEGVRWLRDFLRAFAAQGRTVVVSSHMLSEVQNTVDDVVVIASGSLRHASSLADLAELSQPQARVSSPDGAALRALAERSGWTLRPVSAHARPVGNGLRVDIPGVSAEEVGALAFTGRVELHELTDLTEGLEEIFLRLVDSAPPPARPGIPTEAAVA